ncbi:hypothetical protein E3N88_02388 [Mikania micrantha]|uniref:Dihydroflavonol 4-reductase n=1 Tax=Mikania micrantha TaxID=192012 RepID=A0A5N6Q3U8_9ASTR|nr:hypothetical protein E3N88_02388 [Mikania micrantha]
MKEEYPLTVCVTGAAGFIGSWLVMRLLERGYIVRATNEVIKPTIEGILSIIRSCVKAKTVKKLVFTSSAGTVNVQEKQLGVYDESHWSDLDFIYSKKMTAWMYFVSKTLAERAAWKATEENNIDFISIVPTLVVGPFITPSFPPSLITALSLINGAESHYSIIKQCQYVHLDDLCESHIFLYENPKANGRYICSSHDATIHQLARMIKEKWPEYHVPTRFMGIEEDIPVVSFSSKKLTDMGFEFKYDLVEMFKGAIDSCREKGLLPYSTKEVKKGLFTSSIDDLLNKASVCAATSKERQPVDYLACPNKISNTPGLSKGCRRRSRKAAIQLRERLKDFRVCSRYSFWLRDLLDEAGKHE